MELAETFERCVFSAETFGEALAAFDAMYDAAQTKQLYSTRKVERGNAKWDLDSDEDFLASYAAGFKSVAFTRRAGLGSGSMDFSVFAYDDESVSPPGVKTIVTVKLPTTTQIQRVMRFFRSAQEAARVPLPSPVVFIGHGHSQAWRDLKDHLHEKHGYEVEAYETGARAGQAIQEVLKGLVTAASFAILVMTAEDEQPDGTVRPRENVVHEIGLFQSALGFHRAIVAVEEGIEPFSNLQGTDQMRFASGRISALFGDIVATIEREFPRGAVQSTGQH
jgi:predicted nucleotide-binding protein